jgi:hypothetical protein
MELPIAYLALGSSCSGSETTTHNGVCEQLWDSA